MEENNETTVTETSKIRKLFLTGMVKGAAAVVVGVVVGVVIGNNLNHNTDEK